MRNAPPPPSDAMEEVFGLETGGEREGERGREGEMK